MTQELKGVALPGLQGMERTDLPIVVFLKCFADKIQYLGRLATDAEYADFKSYAGYRPEDLGFIRCKTHPCKVDPEVTFVVGAMRGPHHTSPGNPLRYQFAVRTEDGWVPFLGKTEVEARGLAEQFQKTHYPEALDTTLPIGGCGG